MAGESADGWRGGPLPAAGRAVGLFQRHGEPSVTSFPADEVALLRRWPAEVIGLLADGFGRADPVVERLFADLYRDDPAAALELRTSPRAGSRPADQSGRGDPRCAAPHRRRGGAARRGRRPGMAAGARRRPACARHPDGPARRRRPARRDSTTPRCAPPHPSGCADLPCTAFSASPGVAAGGGHRRRAAHRSRRADHRRIPSRPGRYPHRPDAACPRRAFCRASSSSSGSRPPTVGSAGGADRLIGRVDHRAGDPRRHHRARPPGPSGRGVRRGGRTRSGSEHADQAHPDGQRGPLDDVLRVRLNGAVPDVAGDGRPERGAGGSLPLPHGHPGVPSPLPTSPSPASQSHTSCSS